MSILKFPLDQAYGNVAEAATRTDANEILKRVRELRAEDNNDLVHNGACEVAFREEFIHLIETVDIEKDDSSPIWSLLDAVTLLCDNGFCEPAVGFYLLEDLLESQTIRGALEVFRYMEDSRERMTRINFTSKKLPILRCCNELLRRLSRAEDIIFCGRVFIYMFQFFALTDKSSFNLRGEFHVENVTTYDEQVDEDTQMMTDSSTPLQENSIEASASLRQLYPAFWSLQSYFTSPPSLFAGNSMQSFKESMKQTLECFSKIATHSAVPTNTTNSEKRGQKRRRDGSEIQNAAFNTSTFNPKYLTNKDLFALEVQDIDFRRHVLVQALILLDFLLSLTKENKAKLTVAYPNRSNPVYDRYTFSDEDKLWALETRKEIEKHLEEGNGAEGRYYLRMVNMVISRDKNWALWKFEGCPFISRPPIASSVEQESEKSLEKVAETSNAALRVPKGSDQLIFLSNSIPLEELRNKRAEVPTLEQYYERIQREELDYDFADTDQEKREIEDRKAGQLWRALRSAKGRRFQLCEDLKNGDGALVGKVKSSDDQEPQEQSVDLEQVKTEDGTEDTAGDDLVKVDA